MTEPTSSLTFRGLSISFDQRVLRPRPWTEAQSAWAAGLLADAPAGPVLELCSGVGHIGLAAVKDSPRNLIMVDADTVAHRFAQANAAANSLASRAEVRLARLEKALRADERFALIIADPPWVRSQDTDTFPDDPLQAIDGGDDGLDLARSCVDIIDRHLAIGGSALLQVGSDAQAEAIAAHADGLSPGSVTVVETSTFDDGVIIRLKR